jgi:hypothetical protein
MLNPIHTSEVPSAVDNSVDAITIPKVLMINTSEDLTSIDQQQLQTIAEVCNMTVDELVASVPDVTDQMT